METQAIISSGILEMYVMGLTSEAENVQVQQWMVQYPEIEKEINRIEVDMETYAQAHAVAPAASIKENIFRNIEKTPTQNPVSTPAAKVVNMLPFWKTLAAASVVLLLVSSLVNLVFYNKYQTAQKEVVQKETELAYQKSEYEAMRSDMSVVQNKYSVPVALQGLPAAPDAAAKIFWMKNTGDVYVDVSNLPETPAGKQYQLWAIVDGKPVDAGMIITTKKGNEYRIQKMKAFGKAEAFAITLEKEGGNPTPQGDMYVMGKM